MEVYWVFSIAIPGNLAHHLRRLNKNLKQMIWERERERESAAQYTLYKRGLLQG